MSKQRQKKLVYYFHPESDSLGIMELSPDDRLDPLCEIIDEKTYLRLCKEYDVVPERIQGYREDDDEWD
jgi:hypothetical protein